MSTLTRQMSPPRPVGGTARTTDENSLGNLTFDQSDVLRLGLMAAGCAIVACFATRGQQVPA